MPRKAAVVQTPVTKSPVTAKPAVKKSVSAKVPEFDPSTLVVSNILGQLRDEEANLIGISYDSKATSVEGVIRVSKVLNIGAAIHIDLKAWIAAGRPEQTRPTHSTTLKHDTRGSERQFFFRKEVFTDVLEANSETLDESAFDEAFRLECLNLIAFGSKYVKNITTTKDSSNTSGDFFANIYHFSRIPEPDGIQLNYSGEQIAKENVKKFSLKEILKNHDPKKQISVIVDSGDLEVSIEFDGHRLNMSYTEKPTLAVIHCGNVRFQFNTFTFVGDSVLDESQLNDSAFRAEYELLIQEAIRQKREIKMSHGITVGLSDAVFKFL